MKILLCDDNPHFLSFAAAYLGGFPNVEIVGMAHSGLEAIEKLQTTAPELVLMDIEMPGLDGIATTLSIKSQPGAPRVLLVTSHHEIDYRIMGAQAGADGFIAKNHFARAIQPLLDSLARETSVDPPPALAA